MLYNHNNGFNLMTCTTSNCVITNKSLSQSEEKLTLYSLCRILTEGFQEKPMGPTPRLVLSSPSAFDNKTVV